MAEASVSVPVTQSLREKLAQLSDWIPRGPVAWITVVIALIVLVALSRLISLQKSVADLQARPLVDEHLVRQIVRTHLEETVRAMDQQNKIQMQLRHQQMQEQIKKAQEAAAEQKAKDEAAAAETNATKEEEKPAEPKPVESTPASEEVQVTHYGNVSIEEPKSSRRRKVKEEVK